MGPEGYWMWKQSKKDNKKKNSHKTCKMAFIPAVFAKLPKHLQIHIFALPHYIFISSKCCVCQLWSCFLDIFLVGFKKKVTFDCNSVIFLIPNVVLIVLITHYCGVVLFSLQSMMSLPDVWWLCLGVAVWICVVVCSMTAVDWVFLA